MCTHTSVHSRRDHGAVSNKGHRRSRGLALPGDPAAHRPGHTGAVQGGLPEDQHQEEKDGQVLVEEGDQPTQGGCAHRCFGEQR